MDSLNAITSSPGKAYDYIYNHFGLTGLIVAGVVVVVAIVGFFIAMDRRK
ncbi:MAG TPA: hypothetical protein VKD71_06845 [Gemmataceae bacterium]|nr:hypothetical protein [Gemmataceae bacterium]